MGPATASGSRDAGPVGWAFVNGGTTGGAGAGPESVWTVSTRAELKEALANRGEATAPKVIRVEGDISGHEAGDGTLLGEQDYALAVITGRNIWIDHCTFTDGRYPDRTAPPGFHGERVQRHDGLLDIEDGSDFITVSDSRFTDHDKAVLIGSGDGRGDRDRGHLKVTFVRNLFTDIGQRAPRVRFGQVHVVNNVYRGRGGDTGYALGIGVESAMVSERNVFLYEGPDASSALVVAIYGGTRFRDTGSWLNGRPAGLDAAAAAEAADGFTTDTGWAPADVYPYRSLRSPGAVRWHVLNHSGPRHR
ncbi:pectate lyase family protein [Streptomyces flaveus]|uniref:pectate lyase family protein n=1 Tax=Streptomyces flaveus TaxID=66370 RepID=UPI001FECC9E7|nr:hypothetical protein [Streptomyces flaveus]